MVDITQTMRRLKPILWIQIATLIPDSLSKNARVYWLSDIQNLQNVEYFRTKEVSIMWALTFIA